MKPFEILLQDNMSLRQLLDIYLELRKHFQEMGFSESDLDDPPTYTIKMMGLHEKFSHKLNSLHNYIKDYGFDISREELVNYIQPLLMNINELTPLKDGNTERDNSRYEDY
jgi:hypothetical protein